MISNVVYDKQGNKFVKAHAINALEAVQSGQYTWEPPGGELKEQSEEIKAEIKIQTMSKIPLIEYAAKELKLELDASKSKGELVAIVLAAIARQKATPEVAQESEPKEKTKEEAKPEEKPERKPLKSK